MSLTLFLPLFLLAVSKISSPIDAFSSGSFQALFKTVIMKSVLKQTTLNPKFLKNYRPVSSLSFLSKVLKRIVLLQHDLLFNVSETIFRQTIYSTLISQLMHHSTGTALHKIVNNLLSAQDDSRPLQSLLDLSAAFDTIDHSILLSRLNTSFGLASSVLSWFHSYLSNHIQTVSVSGSKSLPTVLQFGVPQGSVLAPIIFILYIQPLSANFNHHSLFHHSFSDDYQLYVSAHLSELHEIISSSQACISSVQVWMHHNKLQ